MYAYKLFLGFPYFEVQCAQLVKTRYSGYLRSGISRIGI